VLPLSLSEIRVTGKARSELQLRGAGPEPGRWLTQAAGEKDTEPLPPAGEVDEVPVRLKLKGLVKRAEPGLGGAWVYS
jgi:hypothetical protein